MAVELAAELADVGRRFHDRGWMLGTSGNLSAVAQQAPLRLVMTPSGAHKGRLTAEDFVLVDERGAIAGHSAGRPSAETLLHLEIVRARQAGAVLHTHSIWGTMLSDSHADVGSVGLEGYEMLKGLAGVLTHEHHETVPIVANDQDIPRLAAEVRGVLAEFPAAHGFLIRRHGLYTWGRSVAEAERHVETFEFLFEVIARSRHGHRHDS